MRSLTFFPPSEPKGGNRAGRGWLLAALLTLPLTAWAGFATDDRSFDSQAAGGWVAVGQVRGVLGNDGDIDMAEFMSEQSFKTLSAGAGEAKFPWAGRDVLTAEPDWQNALGTSLMPSAIPEPQAAAMWLTGLVAFGFIARRRSGG